MAMWLFVFILAIIFIVMVIVGIWTERIGVSFIGIILMIFVCFGIVAVFESNETFDHEIQRYEIVDTTLTSSGKSGTPTYIVSYKGVGSEICMKKCYMAYETTEDSYLAKCRFTFGFLVSDEFVYFKNVSEGK